MSCLFTKKDIIYPPIDPEDQKKKCDSNIVKGTFKFDDGGVHEIKIPYSGIGYPIGLFIGRSEGFGDWQNDYDVNATMMFTLWKEDTSTEPTYSSGDSENNYAANVFYRLSSSAAVFKPMAEYSVDEYAYIGSTAVIASEGMLRLRDNKTLSVWIRDPDYTYKYGFMNGVEYAFYVFYAEPQKAKKAVVGTAIVGTDLVG